MSSPSLPHAAPSYGVVVPVKPLSRAKSRLSSLGDDVRRGLMLAFVVDTVNAVLDCAPVRRVLVVTDEVSLARGLADLGVDAIPDGHTGDLNASLVQGAAELVRRDPALRPVALCGDLPALRSDELADVLGASAAHPVAFVADAAGTGTTLYTAESLEAFAPRFGAGSREAHRAAGAVEIGGDAVRSVRQDVDTPDDLADALALGVGARTAWVSWQAGLRVP
jgi:2-phospho-L-lactate guanylyltransferase